MSFGSGGGDQDVTQTNEPWSGQRPYLTDIYKQAQLNYGQPPNYFPNAGYVPFAPQSAQALQMMESRALQGSPLNTATQQTGLDTVSGAYLNSNPYIDAQFEQAMRGVLPHINATFGTGGRTGSVAHTNAVGSGLSDLATNIYGGNYQAERDRQMAAMAMTPSFANIDYAELGQLGNVGQAIEGKAQQALQDEMSRYSYYQNLPNAQLQQYSGIVNALPGGYGTQQTEGAGGNPLMGAIGGGIAGAGLQSAPFFAAGGAGAAFGPYLPLIGAGLGLFS